ncbi:hypothetical protein BGY98DRAFT_1095056 [Russula aff. rugulosa BPL654]|nr:hypothetical protein BGY98DRAFT_1095056 [Russula aff. rugulosa BPL654]
MQDPSFAPSSSAPPPHFSPQDSDSSSTATSPSRTKASLHDSHLPGRLSRLTNGKSGEEPHDGLREDDSHDTGASRTKKGKGGRKSKHGKKKRKDKNSNLTEVLLRYLLLFFTIYSLSACPHDAELKSPICRGLSEYRRLILEPYILPAVNKALSHPSVLPYIDRAMPYANQAIRIASPVVLRTQHEWNHRIVPQWNKVIVPQYHKYLTPQLQRVSAATEPYLSAAQEKYESSLGPHVRIVINTMDKCQRAARPYVLIAADRTYSAYQAARPYMRPVWQRIMYILKQLLIFLRAQRRQFVDPHVARIWERIKELSRGGDETVTAHPPSTPSVSVATSVGAPVVSPIIQGVSARPDEAQQTASVEPVGPSSVATLSSDSLPISTPISEPSQTGEEAAGAFSETSPSVTAHTSPVGESISLSTTAPSSTPAISRPLGDDVDLNAFYADIEFSEDEPEPEVQEEDVADTEIPPLTEEQLEERRLQELAKTAEKRRNIMSRHSKWEEKLEITIKANKKSLRKALVALRKAAVQDLKTNKDVHSAIEQLVENAEKFLKGAEAYLNKLKAESQTTDEKVILWTKVLAKIDTKFAEHLRRTEDVVNGWYTKHLEKEMQEVRRAVEQVKEVADDGQSDVGYDYIWLADVTYHDWQRYHALVGRSNNFTDLANSIQNGSHPSPPIDPIPSAMDDLRVELQDVIAGFETRFRRIKRNGFRTFDSLPGDTVDEEEYEQVFESRQPPEVSILPIPEDEPNTATPILGSEFPVVGRGKAEVEEAFARAEAVMDGEHPQDSTDDENGVGPGLVTPTAVPPSASQLHEEL